MAATSILVSKEVEAPLPPPSWSSEGEPASAAIAAVNADRSGGGAGTREGTRNIRSTSSSSQGYYIPHQSPLGPRIGRSSHQDSPPAPPISSRPKYQHQHQHMQLPQSHQHQHYQRYHYYYQYQHEPQSMSGGGPPWPTLMSSVPLPPSVQPPNHPPDMQIPPTSPMILQDRQERGEGRKRGKFQHQHQQQLEQLRIGEMNVGFEGGEEQHQQQSPSASPVGATALAWVMGLGLRPSRCLTFITYLTQGHLVIDRARSLLQAWHLFDGHNSDRDFTQGHLHLYSFILGFIPYDLPSSLPHVVLRSPPSVGGGRGEGGGGRGGGSASPVTGGPVDAETARAEPPVLLRTTGERLTGEEGQERKVKRPRRGEGIEKGGGRMGERDQLQISFPASSLPPPSFVPPLSLPISSSSSWIAPSPMAVLRASMRGATPDPELSQQHQQKQEEMQQQHHLNHHHHHHQQQKQEEMQQQHHLNHHHHHHQQQQQQHEQQQSVILLDDPLTGHKVDEYAGRGGRERGERREGGWHDLPFDLPPPEANAVMARCGVFWSLPAPEEIRREERREGGRSTRGLEVICDDSFARMFMTEEAIRREMMEKGQGIEAIWECIIAPESLPLFYEALIESGFCVPLNAIGCSRKVLKMLGRLERDHDTAVIDTASGSNDGGERRREGKAEGKRLETAPFQTAAAADDDNDLGPLVLLPNEYEAFITTYVSEDGHHWALTLDVLPLLSAEEEAETAEGDEEGEEEEGSMCSFMSSLPTSPLADPEDSSWLTESSGTM